MRCWIPHTEAIEKADTSIQKSPKELLRELYQNIYKADIPNADGYKDHVLLGQYASLLVSISRETAETADKNIIIQNNLIYLTKWLLGITAVLLVIAVLQVAIMFMTMSIPPSTPISNSNFTVTPGPREPVIPNSHSNSE